MYWLHLRVLIPSAQRNVRDFASVLCECTGSIVFKAIYCQKLIFLLTITDIITHILVQRRGEYQYLKGGCDIGNEIGGKEGQTLQIVTIQYFFFTQTLNLNFFKNCPITLCFFYWTQPNFKNLAQSQTDFQTDVQYIVQLPYIPSIGANWLFTSL